MNDTGDIGSIISKLTENPEMMKSLMGIAGNLMNSRDDEESKSERNFRPTEREVSNYPQKECRESREEPLDCRGNGCSQNHGKGDDAENLIRLLIALKPYVGAERCGKIDSIVKILKLVQLSEKTGLLKSLL